MHLHTLVLKDISRRKTKLALAVLSVVVASAAIVAVITTFSATTQGLYEESSKFGANIIVRPEVKSIPLVAGSTSIGSLSTGENYINESDIPKIYTIKNKLNLAVVAPNLYGIAQLGNSSVVVMGVDIEKEKKLKTWWNIDGRWMNTSAPTSGQTEIMVGSDIAVPLGLKEGSQITLTQGNISIKSMVTGVIEKTGSNEDGYLILPLSTAQYLLSKEGKISSLEVRALCNNCPVDDMSNQIQQVIPGVEARPMSQIVKNEMAVIEHTQSSATVVSIITLLVSTLTVASTMLASVNEKFKEIGIMRAIGASDMQVVFLLFFEGAIIGTVGGVIGFVLGTFAALFAAPYLVSVTPSPMWEILPVVFGICIATGMVASIIPARRALRIDPAVVLRSV